MTTHCLNLIHKESMNVKKNVLYATICVALYKMKIMTIYFTYREINNVHLFMNEESLVASPIMRLTNVGIIAQNINIFFWGGGINVLLSLH